MHVHVSNVYISVWYCSGPAYGPVDLINRCPGRSRQSLVGLVSSWGGEGNIVSWCFYFYHFFFNFSTQIVMVLTRAYGVWSMKSLHQLLESQPITLQACCHRGCIDPPACHYRSALSGPMNNSLNTIVNSLFELSCVQEYTFFCMTKQWVRSTVSIIGARVLNYYRSVNGSQRTVRKR